MIVAVLVVLGLCLGSFVNALVWRLHEQEKRAKKKPTKSRHAELVSAPRGFLNGILKLVQDDAKGGDELSILKGRSMCPHCKHELKAIDLVPILSWLSLRGKCRYCHKPISAQYPLVELATAAIFIASYFWWPTEVHGAQILLFIVWLKLLTGFMALTVYDLKWYLLPNRIVYPLTAVAGVFAIIQVIIASNPGIALLNVLLAVAVGGGIFYVLFQVSQGKWIGGGDVKLGWLLGLVVATPARSLLFIFLAALAGSVVSLPLLASGRMKRTATIPFGPFLMLGCVLVQLFGASLLHWYRYSLLNLH